MKPHAPGLTAFRIGLPGAIAVAGVILLVVGGGTLMELGAALLGIAVIVAIIDLAARLSISSQDDREREAAARERYRRTGRWSTRQR